MDPLCVNAVLKVTRLGSTSRGRAPWTTARTRTARRARRRSRGPRSRRRRHSSSGELGIAIFSTPWPRVSLVCVSRTLTPAFLPGVVVSQFRLPQRGAARGEGTPGPPPQQPGPQDPARDRRVHRARGAKMHTHAPVFPLLTPGQTMSSANLAQIKKAFLPSPWKQSCIRPIFTPPSPLLLRWTAFPWTTTGTRA